MRSMTDEKLIKTIRDVEERLDIGGEDFEIYVELALTRRLEKLTKEAKRRGLDLKK